MQRKHFVFLSLLAVVASIQIIRGNVVGGIGGNGQHVRPFYNIAHNPNELSEATQALDAGANALEPDLMRFSDSAIFINGDHGVYINPHAGASGLFMYHDDVVLTTRMPVTVESYFDHAHALAKEGKNLALMVLDIKSPAAAYLGLDGARRLRTALATHLNYDGVDVAILYNVGSTSDSNYFMDNICLGPREGIIIDGENDASGVLNTLLGHITTANSHAAANCGGNTVPYNVAFGNGSFGESFGFAPNVLPSIMQASWIRAGQPNIGNVAIGYAYPIDGGSRMNDYITAGVDGLIPDEDIQPQIWFKTLEHLTELAGIVSTRSDVYMATAADNPFHPPNEAYGLRVDTADVLSAGTDAKLTFKLTGSCGSAQVTIDTSYQKLFERGDRNYVTIQSKNLGLLKKLEVSSDCSGVGPTWNPGNIQVSSARWGISYSADRHVDFGAPDVCSGSAVKDLGDWGRECDTTPPLASPAQSPDANGSGWNNSDVTVNWNWTDNVGGSGIDPDACTTSSVSSGEGTLTLNATCKDLDGNTGSKSYTVKVDKTAPTITIAQPAAAVYVHSATLTLNYTVVDGGSDVASVTPAMDGSATVGGVSLPSGTAINLLESLTLGPHTFTVNATDNAGNASLGSATFTIVVTAESVAQAVNQLLASGAVGAKSGPSLQAKLTNAMAKRNAGQCAVASDMYSAFINEVSAQSGKSITPTAAAILIADAQYLIAHCP